MLSVFRTHFHSSYFNTTPSISSVHKFLVDSFDLNTDSGHKTFSDIDIRICCPFLLNQ